MIECWQFTHSNRLSRRVPIMAAIVLVVIFCILLLILES